MVLSTKSAGAVVAGKAGGSGAVKVGVTTSATIISGTFHKAGATVEIGIDDWRTLSGITPPKIREATEAELAAFRRETTDQAEARELEEAPAEEPAVEEAPAEDPKPRRRARGKKA